MIGIYKITNPKGKIYIGQSWNLKKRENEYKSLRCKAQVKLYNSLLKYGWDSHKFEIIHSLSKESNQSELDYWEIFYWKECKESKIEVLNIKEPGSKGRHSEETKDKIRKFNLGKTQSLETINKRSLSNKGKDGPNKGRKWTEEYKNNMSKTLQGRKLSEDHKNKIGKSHKGKCVSQETRDKIKESKKEISEETKQKMRNAKLGNKNRVGKIHSEETKQKIKESLKKEKNYD